MKCWCWCWIYDPKQKHQELHTSERTIVPRTFIFIIVVVFILIVLLCLFVSVGVWSIQFLPDMAFLLPSLIILTWRVKSVHSINKQVGTKQCMQRIIKSCNKHILQVVKKKPKKESKHRDQNKQATKCPQRLLKSTTYKRLRRKKTFFSPFLFCYAAK